MSKRNQRAKPPHPRVDRALDHRIRKVFISYRRDDSDPAAAHLYASLSQKLGADSVFRDLATIQPGEDFPAAIEAAIRESTAVLALIGPTWLTVKREGSRRLDDPNDFVRREIESALALRVPLIPVLVDGAKMPTKVQLPPSIAELANRNAYTLPWQQAVDRLFARIDELERERAEREQVERVERERLDLGRRIGPGSRGVGARAGSADVAVRAMEMSLAHQGRRRLLDRRDLAASITELYPSFAKSGGFLWEDLIYIIDVVGVKTKASKEGRFVARSYALHGLDDVSSQLQLGRPILAGMTAFESWNREPALTTGFVDGEKSGNIVVGFVGAIIGWDPFKQQFRVLAPWSQWGEKGIATLTMKAAIESIDPARLRSIEAAPKPTPSSTVPAAAGAKASRVN